MGIARDLWLNEKTLQSWLNIVPFATKVKGITTPVLHQKADVSILKVYSGFSKRSSIANIALRVPSKCQGQLQSWNDTQESKCSEDSGLEDFDY